MFVHQYNGIENYNVVTIINSNNYKKYFIFITSVCIPYTRISIKESQTQYLIEITIPNTNSQLMIPMINIQGTSPSEDITKDGETGI